MFLQEGMQVDKPGIELKGKNYFPHPSKIKKDIYYRIYI